MYKRTAQRIFRFIPSPSLDGLALLTNWHSKFLIEEEIGYQNYKMFKRDSRDNKDRQTQLGRTVTRVVDPPLAPQFYNGFPENFVIDGRAASFERDFERRSRYQGPVYLDSYLDSYLASTHELRKKKDLKNSPPKVTKHSSKITNPTAKITNKPVAKVTNKIINKSPPAGNSASRVTKTPLPYVRRCAFASYCEPAKNFPKKVSTTVVHESVGTYRLSWRPTPTPKPESIPTRNVKISKK